VELLIVIAIVGILMALLLPALSAVRTSSRAAACRNNLRQLGTGVLGFASDRDGQLPVQWRRPRLSAAEPTDNFSWAVEVLPYIDQQVIKDNLNLEATPLDPVNRPTISVSIPVFECPATPGSPRRITQLGSLNIADGTAIAARDYVAIHRTTAHDGNGDVPGIWSGAAESTEFPRFGTTDSLIPESSSRDHSGLEYTQRSFLSLARDGLSNTALLVEQAGKPELHGNVPQDESPLLEGPWATGERNLFTAVKVNENNINNPYGFHGAASVVMADGSVHSWDESMDIRVLRSLLSRSGGEIVSDADWR
jgi:type II secretory pathway pseudopilin PulG